MASNDPLNTPVLFAVTAEHRADTVVLRVVGDLEMLVTDQFRDAVDAAIVESSHVVLDFSQLAFMDSSGLSAVLDAAGTAHNHGVRFEVCRPRSPEVAKLLEVTGTLPALAVVDAPPF